MRAKEINLLGMKTKIDEGIEEKKLVVPWFELLG